MKPFSLIISLAFAVLTSSDARANNPLLDLELTPNVFSPDLRELPAIELRNQNGGLNEDSEGPLINPEIEVAVINNDFRALERLLKSGSLANQKQAAIAMGALTSHKAQGVAILKRYIGENSNFMRTEFGEQRFARENAIIAANESLVFLSTDNSESPHKKWRFIFLGIAVFIVIAGFLGRRYWSAAVFTNRR